MKGVIEAELFAMDAEVVESICDAASAPRSITLARHGPRKARAAGEPSPPRCEFEVIGGKWSLSVRGVLKALAWKKFDRQSYG